MNSKIVSRCNGPQAFPAYLWGTGITYTVVAAAAVVCTGSPSKHCRQVNLDTLENHRVQTALLVLTLGEQSAVLEKKYKYTWQCCNVIEAVQW
jgi:hypothetical protein